MNAHDLTRYQPAQFEVVFSSHLIEHLERPLAALVEWWRVLKPGGLLIVCCPHRDLYEKRRSLPSRFNPDHKFFLLPDRDDPPCTFSLAGLVARACPDSMLLELRTCNDGYNNGGRPSAHPSGEYSIEGIWLKPGAGVPSFTGGSIRNVPV